MLPRYAESWREQGGLAANAHIDIRIDHGSMLGLDGQRGFGQVVGHEAMTLGIERAKSHGSCIMALGNADHLCRLGRHHGADNAGQRAKNASLGAAGHQPWRGALGEGALVAGRAIGGVDDDVVDGSNLQRQVIHTDARIGMPKVFSAQEQLQALNPFVDVRPYNRRLGADDAETLFAEYDIIMDGSDNFDTRYLANSVAHRLGKPLVSGALTQWEGQLSVIDTANGTPCYQCTFPQRPARPRRQR